MFYVFHVRLHGRVYLLTDRRCGREITSPPQCKSLLASDVLSPRTCEHFLYIRDGILGFPLFFLIVEALLSSRCRFLEPVKDLAVIHVSIVEAGSSPTYSSLHDCVASLPGRPFLPCLFLFKVLFAVVRCLATPFQPVYPWLRLP